jgi:hypothetical protein
LLDSATDIYYYYELCYRDLYLGGNISVCEVDAITEDDFGLLADGTYQDNNDNTYSYTQILEFQNQNTGQFIFTQDDADAPIADAYLFIDNSNQYLYNYSLEFDNPFVYDSTSEEAVQTDLVGTTLEIQGERYTISDVNLSSGRISQIMLEDSEGTVITIRSNDEAQLDSIDIDGTLSIIDSTAGTLSGFNIAFAPDTDEVYLTEGDEYVDPTFGNFGILFEELVADYEEIEFVTRADLLYGETYAEVLFTNNDGTEVVLPLAADAASQTGEASDEPIYWGYEAPTSTTANQDELLYLEGEMCSGFSSVVDCQGAMFLVIDDDNNAHLIQITNIDTDNFINFADLTYGTTDDNILYTDGAASTILLTSAGDIELTIDEASNSITFTELGDPFIITYNFAVIDIVNTDTSSQTFEGIHFTEYYDGVLNPEKYLWFHLITAVFDDLTDNNIEIESSSVTFLTSSDGYGMYDVSDENDDYQKFMTWKGSLFTYDRENQQSLTIDHPFNTIYAVVSLESIE